MIVAVITAAGASERMGRPKALLDWHGVTFLKAMVETARESGIERIAVVVGGDRESVSAEAANLDTSLLENPAFEKGRGTSLRAAADWAVRQGGTRLLLWPVDCPAVSVRTVHALLAPAATRPDADFFPGSHGRGGHPVLLCGGTAGALRSAEDDLNLREFLRSRPVDRVCVPVDDPAVLDNVNTPEDYRRFLDARRREDASREADVRA